MIVSPSILAADFNNLDQEMNKINNSICEFVHLDVMDGVFVPNTTFDYKLVKELRNKTNKVFDVHLMIEKPELVLDKYYDAGADYVTFHLEACPNALNVIKEYKQKNKSRSRERLFLFIHQAFFRISGSNPVLQHGN